MAVTINYLDTRITFCICIPNQLGGATCTLITCVLLYILQEAAPSRDSADGADVLPPDVLPPGWQRCSGKSVVIFKYKFLVIVKPFCTGQVIPNLELYILWEVK